MWHNAQHRDLSNQQLLSSKSSLWLFLIYQILFHKWKTYISSLFSLVYNDITEITNGEQPQVKGRDDQWTYLNSIANLALDTCQDPLLAHAYRGVCRETSGCRRRPEAGFCRSTEALEVTLIWHLRLALNSQQKIKRSLRQRQTARRSKQN